MGETKYRMEAFIEKVNPSFEDALARLDERINEFCNGLDINECRFYDTPVPTKKPEKF